MAENEAKETRQKVSPRTKSTIAAFAVLAIMGGAFAVRAGYLPENLAALIGLSQPSSLTVTANKTFPVNIILDKGQSPQPSSVLGVFDLAPRGGKGAPIHFVTIPIKVDLANADKSVRVSNFSLQYQYCLPKGTSYAYNVYGYGRRYGYATNNCYTSTVVPSSAIQNSTGGWNLAFQPSWPVFPQALYSKFILHGVVGYTKAPVNKNPNKVRASFMTLGARALTIECKNVKTPGYGYGYGYGFSYGYHPTKYVTTCQRLNVPIKATSGIGTWLTIPPFEAKI